MNIECYFIKFVVKTKEAVKFIQCRKKPNGMKIRSPDEKDDHFSFCRYYINKSI